MLKRVLVLTLSLLAIQSFAMQNPGIWSWFGQKIQSVKDRNPFVFYTSLATAAIGTGYLLSKLFTQKQPELIAIDIPNQNDCEQKADDQLREKVITFAASIVMKQPNIKYDELRSQLFDHFGFDAIELVELKKPMTTPYECQFNKIDPKKTAKQAIKEPDLILDPVDTDHLLDPSAVTRDIFGGYLVEKKS